MNRQMRQWKTNSTNNKSKQSSHQPTDENLSRIPYTIFPLENLNSKVNAHLKCTNLSGYNFDTLAYEKYTMGKEPQTETDRNFVKNYYLENMSEKMQMQNQIVKELQEETFPFNAYNLAENATKDYYAFEYKRKQYLKAAQRRAKNNSNQWGREMKEQYERDLNERQKWINKILMTMRDLGERMFGLKKFTGGSGSGSNKENQNSSNSNDQEGKERVFLNEKSYVDNQYLKEYKIHDPTKAFAIFEDLRAHMLKKKQDLQEERLLGNKKNTSATASFMSTNNISTQSQGQKSMISVISDIDEKSKLQKQMINELCDFNRLKTKWKTTDVERIKDIILKKLTHMTILECEIERAKRDVLYQGQKRSKSIPARITGAARKEKNSGTNSNDKKKKQKHTRSKSQAVTSSSLTAKGGEVFTAPRKKHISKQQELIKSQLVHGGQFDSVGIKYERTRKYFCRFYRPSSLQLQRRFQEEIRRYEKTELKCFTSH